MPQSTTHALRRYWKAGACAHDPACVLMRTQTESACSTRAMGGRAVGGAHHCRFVASQVACGSDRNGDGTARGSGPGEDAVPRRPWDAAAAVEQRAKRLCVVLRTARPTGGQEANRWKWRRRSDSAGWLERPETRAAEKHPPQGAKALKCASFAFEMC